MHYSYPASTPWHAMDRLELYYSNPSARQPAGDYIRIRNVFVRSTYAALFFAARTLSTRAHSGGVPADPLCDRMPSRV